MAKYIPKGVRWDVVSWGADVIVGNREEVRKRFSAKLKPSLVVDAQQFWPADEWPMGVFRTVDVLGHFCYRDERGNYHRLEPGHFLVTYPVGYHALSSRHSVEPDAMGKWFEPYVDEEQVKAEALGEAIAEGAARYEETLNDAL
jgi:hypothetical protein